MFVSDEKVYRLLFLASDLDSSLSSTIMLLACIFLLLPPVADLVSITFPLRPVMMGCLIYW